MCNGSDSLHTGAVPKTGITIFVDLPKTELLVSAWPWASRSSSLVGGMSGRTFYSLVALGLACWWLSLLWLDAGASGGCALGAGAFLLACGFGVSFFVGPVPKTGFLPQVSPRCFGTLDLSIRSIASAGHMVMCVVKVQMVGARRSPRGDNTGGRGRVLPPPTITLQSRRQVLYFLMHLGVDGVRDGRLSTSRRVPFLGLVLGLRFALPEASRRHLLRAVAAAVFSFPVVAATPASCRGTSQQNITLRCFCTSRR